MNRDFGFSNRILIGVGAGLAAVGGAGYLVYRHIHRDPVPRKWRRVGTLEIINVNPLKNSSPMVISSEDVNNGDGLGIDVGTVRDRKFLVVTDRNQIVTERIWPPIANVQPIAIPNGILFRAPEMPDLVLDFCCLDKHERDVRIVFWAVRLNVMFCGAQFDKWFSRCILNKDAGLRLVYYPYYKPMRSMVPFAGNPIDKTRYMLMSLASIDEINKVAREPFGPLQFRGNLYVKTDDNQPYDEDFWNWVRIGEDVVFRNLAPSARYNFSRLNPETDAEFMRTLRGFRQLGQRASTPAVGIHVGLRCSGKIKLHDVVYVQDR